MSVEVEVRSFITKEEYENLVKFFEKNAKLLKSDSQETHYFTGDKDLRIQKNEHYSKVWLKKGNLHDYFREEIEIKTDKESFHELSKLFKELNYDVKIKWFRNRKVYKYKDYKAFLDHTKGYGYIIELEKITKENDGKKIHSTLLKELENLGIEITPKEDFIKKFEEYEKNWETLTKNSS